MKKIIATILLIFYFGSASSQINNLSDFLEVSNLSLYELTENLQYTWTIIKPTEKASADKSKIVGTYSFTNESNTKQILQRIITMEVQSGRKIEVTNLIFNDSELSKSIIKNLTYKGFSLKGKQGNETMYEDGNSILVIYNNYSEKTLGKGYYKLTILRN